MSPAPVNGRGGLITQIKDGVKRGSIPEDVGRDFIAGLALERVRLEPVPDRLVLAIFGTLDLRHDRNRQR